MVIFLVPEMMQVQSMIRARISCTCLEATGELLQVKPRREHLHSTAHALGRLNSLWTYNFNTTTWTLISGSVNRDQPGIYGTRGVASASNLPGSRNKQTLLVDPIRNQLILFAGFGLGTGATAGSPIPWYA
jgi:hypothetical protein